MRRQEMKIEKFEETVVVDIGSSAIRAGFAGESFPRHSFPIPSLPSSLKPSHSLEQSLASSLSISPFIKLFEESKDGQELRKLGGWARYPEIIKGHHLLFQLDLWENQEYVKLVRQKVQALFQKLFYEYLLVDPRQKKVIFCENLFHPKPLKKLFASVLLEDLKVPKVSFLPSHMTALFPMRTQTGIVVDSGFWETTSLPIFEANPLLNSAKIIPTAGAAVDLRLLELLKEHAELLDQTGEVRLLSSLQDLSFLSLDVLEETKQRFATILPQGDHEEKVEVRIKGERVLRFPRKLAWEMASFLFDGDEDDRSIPLSILEILLWVSVDTRKILASNIIVMGGTAQIPGFNQRLLEKLKEMVQKEKRFELIAHLADHFKILENPFKPNQLPWIGASLVGSIALYTKEYDLEEYLSLNREISDWSNFQKRAEVFRE